MHALDARRRATCREGCRGFESPRVESQEQSQALRLRRSRSTADTERAKAARSERVTETRANSKCAPRRRAIGTVRLSPWECCDGAGRGFRTRGTQADHASRVGRIRRRHRDLGRRRQRWVVSSSKEPRVARGFVEFGACAEERWYWARRGANRRRRADQLPRRAWACRRSQDVGQVLRNRRLRSVRGPPVALVDAVRGSRLRAPVRVRPMGRLRCHRRIRSDLWNGQKPCGVGFQAIAGGRLDGARHVPPCAWHCMARAVHRLSAPARGRLTQHSRIGICTDDR